MVVETRTKEGGRGNKRGRGEREREGERDRGTQSVVTYAQEHKQFMFTSMSQTFSN